MDGNQTTDLTVALPGLLAAAGLSGEFQLQPIDGGANNRVFRVDVGGTVALLKVYFHHRADPRDRLRAEFSFSTFAWNNGMRCLPRPLASDPHNHLGLYEFVKGRRPMPSEITTEIVQQALFFYRELNRHKHQPEAGALPTASEACFSIAAHLDCVEQRVRRLLAATDPEAVSFAREKLSRVWDDVSVAVRRRAAALGLQLEEVLSPADRCLSPSDFGFHNALLEASGQVRFIDFEYAGWDDLAKTVCDFFCQPAVPVSENFQPMFVDAVVENLPERERHAQRILLLLPVYQVKWCCILLNDFLPVGGQRRRFARSGVDQDVERKKQLEMARRAIEKIQS